MADDPDTPFNDGLDTWDVKRLPKWREWEFLQPTHFHPFWRWLNWISLALSGVLLVLSIIHRNYWSLFVAVGWGLASISFLVRDALGRRRSRDHSG